MEYTFENLAKYDANGQEIKYTIDEQEVSEGDLKFYTKTIKENTITNTFRVPDDKTNVKVTKKWEEETEEQKRELCKGYILQRKAKNK